MGLGEAKHTVSLCSQGDFGGLLNKCNFTVLLEVDILGVYFVYVYHKIFHSTVVEMENASCVTTPYEITSLIDNPSR